MTTGLSRDGETFHDEIYEIDIYRNTAKGVRYVRREIKLKLRYVCWMFRLIELKGIEYQK